MTLSPSLPADLLAAHAVRGPGRHRLHPGEWGPAGGAHTGGGGTASGGLALTACPLSPPGSSWPTTRSWCWATGSRRWARRSTCTARCASTPTSCTSSPPCCSWSAADRARVPPALPGSVRPPGMLTHGGRWALALLPPPLPRAWVRPGPTSLGWEVLRGAHVGRWLTRGHMHVLWTRGCTRVSPPPAPGLLRALTVHAPTWRHGTGEGRGAPSKGGGGSACCTWHPMASPARDPPQRQAGAEPASPTPKSLDWMLPIKCPSDTRRLCL